MIDEIKKHWEEENQTPPSSASQEEERTKTNEVFVIHGRDEGPRAMVARFLEQLKLKPVILDEQSNQGLTIIEKFERHAQVGFAVALLTPDDAGSLQGDGSNLNPRARQNVIFELGFFIGKLGREDVCALTKGTVEIPSDYAGVVYIPLDDSEGWKMKLVRELKNAGFDVDANRMVEGKQ
jgi:predicted nucleotide-binding protein